MRGRGGHQLGVTGASFKMFSCEKSPAYTDVDSNMLKNFAVLLLIFANSEGSSEKKVKVKV